MSRTRKRQAAHYVTLLITSAVLSMALAAATKSVPAARGSAIAQATPDTVRGRHNGKIVFTSDRYSTALSIWSMNPDGSSPTRLTDDKSRTEKLPSFVPVYDISPASSPDGTKIVFISNRNNLSALYVMNADGSNARLVTDKVSDPAEPAWSPDGGEIAFSGGARGTIGMDKPFADIYMVNVDGSGLAKLTQDSGLNRGPAWSPDGKQIAFSSNREIYHQTIIWVMNADGSNQRILPNSQNPGSTGHLGSEPAWSPDGTKILFTGSRACGGRGAVAIYVMNADGSNSRMLTKDANGCGRYSSPRWSPDGTKILSTFTPEVKADSSPAPQIVVTNADGSDQINILNRSQYYLRYSTFTDVQADWQPLHAPFNFASSIVGFSEPSYTVKEDAKTLTITIKRTGNLNDVASCFYVPLTDTGIKYDPAATGRIHFARGESSKTISIAITDTGGKFRTLSLKIVLSDTLGNATLVGAIKEAAITILGRDTASRRKDPH